MNNQCEMTPDRRKVRASAIAPGDKPLPEMADLFAKMEKRAFEFSLQRKCEPGKELQDWLAAEREFLRSVPCEAMDKGNELMVRAEVPGFNQRELAVKAAADRLFIVGHKERTVSSSTEGRIFSDRECKDVFREIALPVEVDPQQVTTMLHEGILTIFVRKAENGKKTGVHGT